MAADRGDIRALSISDGMVLVAASAVAVMGFRLTSEHLRWDIEYLKMYWEVGGMAALDWGALGLALAVIVLRLRRPRPSRDRLWRQPGWLACFVVATTLGLEALEIVAAYAAQEVVKVGSSGLDPSTIFLDVLPFHTPEDISRAVIAIWSVLALSGYWAAERSVVDRLGRVVGWYWVFRAVASPLLLLAKN